MASPSGNIQNKVKEVLRMKSKALRIVLLALTVIICLSVGLYAAHSLSHGKVASSNVAVSADTDGFKVVEAKRADPSVLRKID